MKYKVEVNHGGIIGKRVYRFDTLDKAREFVDKLFEKTGDIIAIENKGKDKCKTNRTGTKPNENGYLSTLLKTRTQGNMYSASDLKP